MTDDPFAKLAVDLNEDSKAERKKRGKTAPAEVADTVAAGAIEGAGAALDAGGDARDVAAATIGGAAAATAEALDQVDEQGGASVAEELAEEFDDTTAGVDMAIERLQRIAEEAEFESGSLVGDVRDSLLDLYKAQPKPWFQTKEGDQRNIALALEQCAKAIIKKIVVVVAEDDADGPTIHATMKSYSEDGGFKITLTATGDEDTALALHKAVKQQVIVKRADSQRYSGERREPQFMPDQPPLEFEAAKVEPGAYRGNDDDLGPDFEGEGGELVEGDGNEPEPGDDDADLADGAE